MAEITKLRCRDCFPPGLAWMGSAHEAIDPETHEERCPKCGSDNLEPVGIRSSFTALSPAKNRKKRAGSGPDLFSVPI